MGLRCLLGHDFDEAEIEREREEDGNEMVVTVREFKVCQRCGHEHVISENKEVTSVEPLEYGDGRTAGTESPADDGARSADVPGGDPGGWSPDGTDSGSAGAERPRGDAGVDADAGGQSPRPADADGPTETAGDEPAHPAVDEGELDEEETFDPPESAAEDDGVILDGDAEEEPAREHGEWPESDDVGRSDTDDESAWPDHDGEDEGYAAEVDDGATPDVDVAEDGASAGGVGSPDGDGAGAPTAAPDEGAELIDAESEGESGHDGFVRSSVAAATTAGEGDATEYHCPACGLTEGTAGSSMRSGDICPECQRGYITERAQ